MVRFIRKIQELNRVAIPQEIMNEIKWKIDNIVHIEIQGDGIYITRRE